MPKTRNRVAYGIALLIVILSGLGSRYYQKYLPDFIANYAGDTLWGLMIFLSISFIFREKSSRWVAVSAVTFSYFIEISQLYQAHWINLIRKTFIGLILGYGFIWSDLVCYTVGIITGVLLEILVLNKYSVASVKITNVKFFKNS